MIHPFDLQKVRIIDCPSEHLVEIAKMQLEGMLSARNAKILVWQMAQHNHFVRSLKHILV